jgi:hypothetical protein
LTQRPTPHAEAVRHHRFHNVDRVNRCSGVPAVPGTNPRWLTRDVVTSHPSHQPFSHCQVPCTVRASARERSLRGVSLGFCTARAQRMHECGTGRNAWGEPSDPAHFAVYKILDSDGAVRDRRSSGCQVRLQRKRAGHALWSTGP